MKDAKSVVGNNPTYQRLKESWDVVRDESQTKIKLCVTLILLFGLQTGLFSAASILGWLSGILAGIIIIVLYAELKERFVDGYYLDASFTLEPIDPAYPDGFRCIKECTFRIFRNGENALAPGSSEIRFLIPISGAGEKKGKYIRRYGATHSEVLEFTGRCIELQEYNVLVAVSSGLNKIVLTLDEIVGIVIRHGYSLATTMVNIGSLCATSLSTVERNTIQIRAEWALQSDLEDQHKLAALKELRHWVDPRNTIRGTARKT